MRSVIFQYASVFTKVIRNFISAIFPRLGFQYRRRKFSAEWSSLKENLKYTFLHGKYMSNNNAYDKDVLSRGDNFVRYVVYKNSHF